MLLPLPCCRAAWSGRRHQPCSRPGPEGRNTGRVPCHASGHPVGAINRGRIALKRGVLRFVTGSADSAGRPVAGLFSLNFGAQKPSGGCPPGALVQPGGAGGAKMLMGLRGAVGSGWARRRRRGPPAGPPGGADVHRASRPRGRNCVHRPEASCCRCCQPFRGNRCGLVQRRGSSSGSRARKGSGVSRCVMPPARCGRLRGKTQEISSRLGDGDSWESGPSLPSPAAVLGVATRPSHLGKRRSLCRDPKMAAPSPHSAPAHGGLGGCQASSPAQRARLLKPGPPWRDFHFIFKYLDSAVLICFLVSILISNTRQVGGVCFRW